MIVWFRFMRLHFRCFSNENEAKERSRGLRPSTPRTALRQLLIDKPHHNPFGEPSQTQPLTRLQTHGKVRFCPTGKNPLTSHAVSKALCCLGLPSAVTLTKAGCENCVVVKLTGCTATPCVPKMVPYKSLALTTSCGSRILLKAKAAPAESFCVAREGISPRSGETKRLLV